MPTLTDPIAPTTRAADQAASPSGARAPSAGRVGPGPSLPSGRAVVGGLLMTLAVMAVLTIGRPSTDPGTPVVVVREPIDAGTVVGPAHLDVRSMTLDPDTQPLTFRTIEDVTGAVALAPMRPGELVQAGAILTPRESSRDGGDGDDAAPASGGTEREFSFRLPRDQAVDGMLNRGERVDVLATYGSGTDAVTSRVVASTVVTRVDNQSDAGIGRAAEVTVTLALESPTDVLALTHAKDVATVTLVRSTRAGSDPIDDGTPSQFTGPQAQDAAPPADEIGDSSIEGAGS